MMLQAVPALVSLLLVAPVPVEIPPLPSTSKGCVGASPEVARTPSWAQERMAPHQLWPLTRGEGVLVAVLDTGVSATVPSLTGAVRRGTDLAGGGAADNDCLGRGTALAGIVAARPVSGAGPVGMAPGAQILPIRITDRDGKITPARLADGLRAATAAGADVVLSGAGVPAANASLRAAVQAALASNVLVVAAVPETTGDADPVGTAWFPAAYPEVLAVAGVTAAGLPAAVHGEAAGIDLLGPAEGAVGPAPAGDGHYSVTGAAVAAAYVAGAAALVRAYHPDLAAAEVAARLLQTAEPAPGGPSPLTGAGVVDPYAAVTALVTADAPVTSDVRPEPAVLPPPPVRDPAGPIAGVVAMVIAGACLIGLAIAAAVRGRRSPALSPDTAA
ncbi:S8 family serine peptidase [Catenuloplanes japonicus]|uniref:S8 family serine peptidase n=1 Tax=Catenuloplanes japonicus TaxID=33876 RepID=UPI0007C52BEA|nr:S8 family serine peptidase [Catenuloplanes japonicus]